MDRNAKSFNTRSSQYARSRPRYPEGFYQYLVSLTDSHERLWDCGCGNGQVAIDLVDHFSEIYATDISENQVRNGFENPKIRYSTTESEHTSFPDHYFDMICIAQALHWFHLDNFFKEADRVLTKGGIMAVFGYGFFRISPKIDEIIDSVLHSGIDRYWSERNRLVMTNFEGISFPFSTVSPPPFTMDQNWDLPALLSYLETWSAVKRYNAEEETNIIEVLKKDLEPVWEPDEMKTVQMDLYSHVRRKE